MKKLIPYALIIVLSNSCSAQSGPEIKKSEIHLTGSTEPGKPLTLELSILDLRTRQPVKDVEIFAYHTNSIGDYENNAQGVARIHGTAYTNENGIVIFHTIYPRGYNNAAQGSHIHFRLKAKGYKANNPTLDFDTKNDEGTNVSANKVYLRSIKEIEGRLTGNAVIYIN